MAKYRRDATIVFAAESGQSSWAATYLARSIDATSLHNSLVFIPEDEYNNIPAATISELRDHTTGLIVDEPTIPGYDHSTKLDAFAAAADHVNPPYVVLDTNTLLLDELPLPLGNHDLVAKPADIGAEYWASDAATAELRDLYSTYGFEFPDTRIKSTVDNHRIPPIFDPRVVGTTEADFPRRWLDLTTRLYQDQESLVDADQIALSMLASEYNVGQLSEKDSYPGMLRVRFPHGIRVLHYHQLETLHRIRNPKYRSLLKKIGVHEQLQQESALDRLSSIASSIYRVGASRVPKMVG